MRKYWLIIVSAVLVAAALLIFLPYPGKFFPAAGRGVVEVVSIPRDREYPLNELIPARAGLMLRFCSAKEFWQRLTSGHLPQALKESPFWREEKIEERLAAFAREFEDRAGFRISRSRIMPVAGEDFALAVIPSDGVFPDGVLVLARLGTRARLLEIFFRISDSLKKETDRFLGEELYRGEKILTVPPGRDLPSGMAYCVIDGHLAAAISTASVRLIQEVIDLSRNEQSPISGSPDYSAALDHSGFPGETFLELYLNPRRYPFGLAESLFPDQLSEGVGWAEVLFQSLKVCQAIGFRAGYREGVHIRSRIIVPQDDLSSGPPPVSGGRISLPGGEMLYGFFAVDPPRAGKRLSELLAGLGIKEGGTVSPGLVRWEAESELSLHRDILPVFGPRSGLVLGGLTGDEFLPLPPFALISSLADREAAVTVMNKVVAWAVLARDLRPVREDYRGVEMTFFPGLFFLEPGFALLEQELVIAGSRAMLKKVVDLRRGVLPSVDSDPVFQRVTAGFDPAAGASFYLDGEIFSVTLQAAAEWYFSYQRLAPGRPILSESLYRQRVLPLLGLFRDIRGGGATVVREKNIVKTDYFLYIPELN